MTTNTVQRWPIGFAKSGEGLPGGLRRIRLPSTQYHGPMRRLKRSTAFLQSSRDCLRGDRASPTRLGFARTKSPQRAVAPDNSARRKRTLVYFRWPPSLDQYSPRTSFSLLPTYAPDKELLRACALTCRSAGLLVGSVAR